MQPAATPCPVCAGHAVAGFITGTGWHIDRCPSCTHRFCRGIFTADHTRTQFDDNYFHGAGVGYPDYLAEAAPRRALGRWYASRYQKLTGRHKQVEPGHLLDVGCAAGFIMQGFADAGWRVTGVDPNPSMVQHARQQAGLEAYVGDALTLSGTQGLNRPETGFDLVTLIQVMGHLIDPERAIREAGALLGTHGLLLIETWNSDSLVARTLGRRWHEYSPPNTLQFFTRKSLDELLKRQGFERVSVGRTPKGLSIEHLRSFVRGRYRGVLGRTLQATLSVVPGSWRLPYPGDDLFHAWYQWRSP